MRDLDLVTDSPDVFDIRDVISRFEELESNDERDTDEQEEYTVLEKLLEETKGNGGDEQWRGDWYPVTFYNESYFEEAMDDMVADCYDMPKDLPSFMTITLDYDALRTDYTSVEVTGTTYLYR